MNLNKKFWDIDIPTFNHIKIELSELAIKKKSHDFKITIDLSSVFKTRDKDFEDAYKNIFKMNFASYDYKSKIYMYYSSGRDTLEENKEKINQMFNKLIEIDLSFQEKIKNKSQNEEKILLLDKELIPYGQIVHLKQNFMVFYFTKRVDQEVFSNLKNHAQYSRLIDKNSLNEKDVFNLLIEKKLHHYECFKQITKKFDEIIKDIEPKTIDNCKNNPLFLKFLNNLSYENMMIIDPLEFDFWNDLIKIEKSKMLEIFQDISIKEAVIKQSFDLKSLEVKEDNVFDLSIEYLEEKKWFKISCKGLLESIDNFGRVNPIKNAAHWASNMLLVDEKTPLTSYYYKKDYHRDVKALEFNFLPDSSRKNKENYLPVDEYEKVKILKENFEKEKQFFERPIVKLKDYNIQMETFFPYVDSQGQAYFIIGKNRSTKEPEKCTLKGFKIKHEELLYLINQHPLHQILKQHFQEYNYWMACLKENAINTQSLNLSFKELFTKETHSENILLLNQIMEETRNQNHRETKKARKL